MILNATGDSPLTIPFYEKCGFKRHHVEKEFFTKNYDHPIFEAGVQLVDMIYLQKKYKGNKNDKNLFCTTLQAGRKNQG